MLEYYLKDSLDVNLGIVGERFNDGADIVLLIERYWLSRFCKTKVNMRHKNRIKRKTKFNNKIH